MSDDDKAERKQVTIAKGLKDLMENMTALIEYERLNARLIREKYIALIGVGFTSAEAIELCKK